MGRPLQIEYEAALYHATSRGNDRKKIFFGKEDFEKIKSYMKEGQEKCGYLIHPNSKIAQLVGGLSYSTVAKAHQRFSARLTRDS